MIFAVFAAIIIIVSSIFIVYNYPKTSLHTSYGLPVRINVSLSGIPTGGSLYHTNNTKSEFVYNLSNASVALLSVNPFWIQTGGNFGQKNITYNLSLNPYIQEVFIGRSNKSGVIHGYVNNSILQIANLWRDIIRSKGYGVSVTEEATYSYIRNGTLYGFNYFNNIEYSPYNNAFNIVTPNGNFNGNAPFVFQSTIHFNLSKPVFVKKMNMTKILNSSQVRNYSISGETTGNPGNLNKCTTSIMAKTIKVEAWTGILPMLYSSMKLPSNSVFSMVSPNSIQNITLKFNSAQFTQGESGTFQSTNSSYYSAIHYFTPSSIDTTTPGNNASIYYVTNISFIALEFTPYYILTYPYNNESNYYCISNPGLNVTNIQIVGSRNQQVKTNDPYNLANNGNLTETYNYWSAAINMLGISTVRGFRLNNSYLAPTLNLSNYSNESKGANDYLQFAENGSGVDSTALGFALAINTITKIMPYAANAEDVMNNVTLAFAEIGLAASMASAFTPISVMSQNLNSNLYIIHNDPNFNSSGSILEMYIYQSSQPVHLYGNNGNLYSFQPFLPIVNVIPL
jgi:hypothetical protein